MRRIPPSLLPFLVAVSLDLAFASSAAHRPHGHLRIDIQSAHDNEGVDAREVMVSSPVVRFSPMLPLTAQLWGQ